MNRVIHMNVISTEGCAKLLSGGVVKYGWLRKRDKIHEKVAILKKIPCKYQHVLSEIMLVVVQ